MKPAEKLRLQRDLSVPRQQKTWLAQRRISHLAGTGVKRAHHPSNHGSAAASWLPKFRKRTGRSHPIHQLLSSVYSVKSHDGPRKASKQARHWMDPDCTEYEVV